MRPQVVLIFLTLLAISAISVSTLLLRRGRLYRRLQPDSRPRRWVLFSILFLFATFIVWFPIWMLWPHALLSRALTLLFGTTFFVVAMTIKWLSGFMDSFIKRRGWPLR